MNILPIPEKQYELRELGRRYLDLLMDGFSKSIEEGIEVTDDIKKYAFYRSDSLMDMLFNGEVDGLEIDYLRTLVPTESYVKSQYSGKLTGGIDKNIDLTFAELEKKGVYFVNSQDDTPRRLKYIEEIKDFKYEDEIKDTKSNVSDKLTYRDIEDVMLNSLDKESGLYDALKSTIDKCKSKNISPKETLDILKKALHDF